LENRPLSARSIVDMDRVMVAAMARFSLGRFARA
jgi:hypothetical protein